MTIKSNDFGFPGFPPFTRGPYASMYLGRPWTIRQYAGFSTAEESNAFYRKNLSQGQMGLSVAFDLATHRGHDSDHPRVFSDVGMAGVAIDSLYDMRQLFDKIPLDEMSVSMTMNGAVLPIMGLYIAAAQEQGVELEKLKGTIQNDILKEFLVRNTYIFPPRPSLKIISDIFQFTSQYMPKFNSISISGYHMQEAGASPQLELAFTLANGLEYLKTGQGAGLEIDDFAPRLSFFWAIGMNFFEEISKLRAARYLWAHLLKSLGAKDPKSMALRTHCQTSGWSLSAQDVMNNLFRTQLEATAAIIGQTQSLHTNSFDEALALPTEHSARLARNTQLFLREEAGLTESIDFLGDAPVVQTLTTEFIHHSLDLLNEIEAQGGMVAAIESGWAKHKIEEQATRTQVAIDSGERKIVGSNCFINDEEGTTEVLAVDQAKVRQSQLEKLKQLKKDRDPERVKKSLANLTCAARKESGNLLALSVEAARSLATVGEMTEALEEVYGRYQAKINVVQGVYGAQMKKNQSEIMERVQKLLEQFKEKFGRPPRILLCKMGQDGHDRGQKIIASAFADLGFDVDVGPLFQTPEESAKQAIENDVHFIGLSSLAAGHLTLVPALKKALEKYDRSDIQIIVGGVIPTQDHEKLYSLGVVDIFGPGTIISEAAERLLRRVLKGA